MTSAAVNARHAGAPAQQRLGLLFPEVSAMIVEDDDGSFFAVASRGRESRISGKICEDIAQSLRAGTATPALRTLAPAHVVLRDVIAWLETPSVPLSRDAAVRLDGFDTLFVELLGRCNERCVHCYADSAPTVEAALDRETVLAAVAEAAAAGFRRIQFTGGDPLLCEFLPDAVEVAARAGISAIEIYTNGLALGDRLLERLAPWRPAFAFSFYSLDPAVHDRITRTPGSQQRTLAAIDRVVARGLPCRAAIVVMEENRAGVDELIDHLRARGVGYVSWSRTYSVGRGAQLTSPAPAPDVGPAPRTVETRDHQAGGTRAGAGKLCLTYTGDVVPCIFQRQTILGRVGQGRTLAQVVAGDQPPRAGRRALPVASEARARLQCASCRLTDMALAWLGSNTVHVR